MSNLENSVKDGQKVVISVRPEEFSISKSGLKCKISNSTFLGKYTNYVLSFEDGMCIENQPSIEFTEVDSLDGQGRGGLGSTGVN